MGSLLVPVPSSTFQFWFRFQFRFTVRVRTWNPNLKPELGTWNAR